MSSWIFCTFASRNFQQTISFRPSFSAGVYQTYIRLPHKDITQWKEKYNINHLHRYEEKQVSMVGGSCCHSTCKL